MPSPAELRAEARTLLCAYALTSITGARPLVLGRHSRPTSSSPTGAREHPAEAWAQAIDAAAADDLARLVRDLRDELDAVRRRPLAEVHGESLEDLHELVLDRGEGFTAAEVAVALRCTPTMVRRARLLAGCDAHRGRRVEVNGNGHALGVELVANGYSVRAAAAIVGVAKSTLADHARRGRS